MISMADLQLWTSSYQKGNFYLAFKALRGLIASFSRIDILWLRGEGHVAAVEFQLGSEQ